MHKISPKQFASACYCIMMGDCEKTSYDYMEQMLPVLEAGYNAFSFLDLGRKLRLIEYLNNWKTEVPAEIKRYKIIPDDTAFDILQTARRLEEEKWNLKNLKLD